MSGKLVLSTAAIGGALYLLCRPRSRSDKEPVVSDPFGIFDFARLVKAKALTTFLRERQRVLGSVFAVRVPPIMDTTMVLDIESVYAVSALENKHQLAIKMPPSYEALHGQDLQLTTGSVHKLWRRILAPVVAPKAMQTYCPRLVAAFGAMWERLASKGTEVVLRDEIRRTQLRAMADILFGITFETEAQFDALDRDFEHEMDALFAIPVNVPGTAFYKGMQAAKRIREFLTKRLRQEVAAYEASPVSPKKGESRPLRNAIQAIVEGHGKADAEVTKEALNEEKMVNNLLLLLEASQGTTMLATTSLLGELNKVEAKDKLDKVRAEVDAIAKSGEVSTQTLDNAEYMTACVNEALRLYPFAGGVPLKVPTGVSLDVLDKVVQGPTEMMLMFSHTFTDPDFFPRPLEFLPERWLPDASPELKVSEKASRAFLPFGLGQHVCLGQNVARLSMKSALYTFCKGGYSSVLGGPVERVPGHIIPEWEIENGVLMRVCSPMGA